MSPVSSFIRFVLLAALVLTASSCASWQTHDGDFADALRHEGPDMARIVLQSGESLELEDPSVVDSMVHGSQGSDGVAVPLTDIATLETGSSRSWMPAVVVAGAVAAAPLLTELVARAAMKVWWPFGPSGN